MSSVWPPLIAEGTVWHTLSVRERANRWPYPLESQGVRVRKVSLWGRDEWVDSEGRVLCVGCGQLIGIEELSRPGNGHTVSPVGSPIEGQVTSWAEHQEGA